MNLTKSRLWGLSALNVSDNPENVREKNIP